MTATPSIDLPGWRAEQLSQASPDLLGNMIQSFAQALMSADADAIICAGSDQRSPDRSNTRNGYRHRGWDTRAGSMRPGRAEASGRRAFPGLAAGAAPAAESALVSVVATSYLLESARGGWRNWSSSWGHRAVQVLGVGDGQGPDGQVDPSAPGRWTLVHTPLLPPTRWS